MRKVGIFRGLFISVKRKKFLFPISSRLWFTSSITSNLFCSRRDGFIRRRVFRRAFSGPRRTADGIRALAIRALFSASPVKSMLPPVSPSLSQKVLSYILFSFFVFCRKIPELHCRSRFMLKPSQLLISYFMFVLLGVFSRRISILNTILLWKRDFALWGFSFSPPVSGCDLLRAS